MSLRAFAIRGGLIERSFRALLAEPLLLCCLLLRCLGVQVGFGAVLFLLKQIRFGLFLSRLRTLVGSLDLVFVVWARFCPFLLLLKLLFRLLCRLLRLHHHRASQGDANEGHESQNVLQGHVLSLQRPAKVQS